MIIRPESGSSLLLLMMTMMTMMKTTMTSLDLGLSSVHLTPYNYDSIGWGNFKFYTKKFYRALTTSRLRHGPNQTRPDQTSRVSDSLRHVWFWLNSIIRARPCRLCRRLSQKKNPPRKTGPQRNCCRFLNYTSMQLWVYYWRRKENTLCGWKSIPVRENSMENVTFYYRNLLLQKWWNVSSICEWI